MQPFFTGLILIAMLCFILMLIAELTRGTVSYKRVGFEVSLLSGYTLALHSWTGFPSSEIAFSEPVNLGFLLLLQMAVFAGIISSQAFDLPPAAAPCWQAFLRPLLIAPMLLLPLLGSLDGCGGLSTLQSASFVLLAFQNGFFWKKIFHQIRKQADTQTEK